MIAGALEIGVPLSSFWRLNMRQLAWHHTAARHRDEAEMTRLYAAMSLEHLSRCGKRLPSLDEFLGRKQKPKIIGDARAFMAHFAASYSGGKIVHKDAVKEVRHG